MISWPAAKALLHPHLYSPHLALQSISSVCCCSSSRWPPSIHFVSHSSSSKARERAPASCASILNKSMSQHHLQGASAVLIFQHLPPPLHLAHLSVSSPEKQTTCDVMQHDINLSSQSHPFAGEISCLSKGRHRLSLTKASLRSPTLHHISVSMYSQTCLYNLLKAL